MQQLRQTTWTRHLWMVCMIGCGLPATQADVKLAGVGLDPDSIGALPLKQGGLVEYSVYDFAGAGLPLGVLGLVSYTEVGPDIVSFKPPYRMVHGLAFVFQDDVMGPESLFGTLPPAPATVGVCQTRYEPRAYISSLVDVGNAITFQTEDGQGGFGMGRRPFVYPPDMRDVNTYYSEIDTWRSVAQTRPARIDPDNNDPDSLVDEVLLPANFPEGRLVSMGFPGGIPPREASMASIPVPLAAAGTNTEVRLPHLPRGVRMSWNGPVYSSQGLRMPDIGEERQQDSSDGGTDVYNGVTWVDKDTWEAEDQARVEEIGSFSTCLQYLGHDQIPASVEDCLELQKPPGNNTELAARGWAHLSPGQLEGQMYTGPWDDTDGVVFDWLPIETGEDEIVTLTVRFLGPVDRTDENMVEGIVRMSPNDPTVKDDLEAFWEYEQGQGRIPDDVSIPSGRRPAMACDEPYDLGEPPVLRDTEVKIDWPLYPGLTDHDGDLVPSLHGDPGHAVAEVTCRLDESSGQFTLTQSILEDAYNYATVRGAEGAIFYFSRATVSTIETPDVRDPYGHRHDISSLQVVNRAAQMGRFWYEQ